MTILRTGVIYDAKEVEIKDGLSGEVVIGNQLNLNEVKKQKISNTSHADSSKSQEEYTNIQNEIEKEEQAETYIEQSSLAQSSSETEVNDLTNKIETVESDSDPELSLQPQDKTLTFVEEEPNPHLYDFKEQFRFLKSRLQLHTTHFIDEITRLRKNNVYAEEGSTWKDVLVRRDNGLPMVDLEATKKDLHDGLVKIASLRLPRLKPFLMGIGIGFLMLGLGLFFMIFSPVIWNEFLFGLKEQGVLANNAEIILNQTEEKQVSEVTEELGVMQEFSFVIPKIDARANIVENVDPLNKTEYLEALKNGVAHAKGTNFPGEGRAIFLFSHSTDSPTRYTQYNAVFYLLKKLEKDDEIIVFRDGKEYRYKVDIKQVVEANDTTWLDPKGSRERLILMTCDPPGTTWKRLMVVALPS